MAETDQVVLWSDLLALIAPHTPKSGQPYPLETTLRIHFLQQWYALSDLSADEASYDTASLHRFAKIAGLDEVPDEMTTLNVRHLPGATGCAAQAVQPGQRAAVALGADSA
ncbi:IS1479 transposase [Xanthomonas bromi]|uniref:IS1479 transposase n=1 Tax=Xanthomonas bromi TaxID=56449 RepID=A0A1C3NJK4_9XANT|nr:IS1479 transposase [Xanthomonas bromi]